MAQTFNGDIAVIGSLSVGGEIAGQTLSKELLNATILAAYPVGAIYCSTSETSPAEMWGGTWEQITADAYLKIVTQNAGVTGGTSERHIIPIDSMPAHNHLTWISPSSGSGAATFDSPTLYDGGAKERAYSYESGGSQPYYPYYYSVYAWIRRA